MSLPTSPIARINGISLTYHESGPQNAPAVVFLHAFPLSSKMWEAQQKALSDKFHTVAYDMRGFGRSEPGDGQTPLEFFVDDLMDLLDFLKLKQVILCGLSMGGYVALRAIERHPERVSGLILCDTRTEADSNQSKLKRAASVRLIKQKGLAAFSQGFLKIALAPETLQEKPGLVTWLKETIHAQNPLGVCAGLLAMAARTDTTHVLASIRVPTLVVTGEKDTFSPPELAKSLSQKIPDASYQIVPRAGHLSNLEQPGAFNQALVDFLDKQRKGL